jgi:hypothetical protein
VPSFFSSRYSWMRQSQGGGIIIFYRWKTAPPIKHPMQSS